VCELLRGIRLLYDLGTRMGRAETPRRGFGVSARQEDFYARCLASRAAATSFDDLFGVMMSTMAAPYDAARPIDQDLIPPRPPYRIL
jgi:hypothetical protein